MKTRPTVLTILACVGVLFLLWLLREPKQHPLDSASVSLNLPADAKTNAARPPTAPRTESVEIAPKARQGANSGGRQRMDSETFNQLLLAEWQVPIEFYGKVIDENSNAVAGASVTFSWNETPERGSHKTLAVQSDAAGLFSLRDARGGILNVAVGKAGYYTPRPGTWSFRYVREQHSITDPANPAVFVLRKKGKGEPLIERELPAAMGTPSPQLRRDGTPIEIDLLSGQIVTGGKGQIKLEFRSKEDRAQPRSSYDWECHLTVTGGGLLEAAQEFAFDAPESGYQPIISIDMSATNEYWQAEISNKYFIHLPDGTFGRIDFHLLAYNGVFQLHSAINPSGSRDLEPN